MKLAVWANELPRAVFVFGLDASGAAGVRTALGKFSGVALTEAESADKGWSICQSSGNPPDLVIIGWKIPGRLSGPGLLNRLRHHPIYAKVPILVLSDVIKRKDFRILEEFPCTQLVEMPANEPRLVQALEEINTERAWNEKNATEINNLFILSRDNPKALAASMRQLLDQSPKPAPIGMLIGNTLIEKGYLQQAEQLYRYLIARDSDNLRVINSFGRLLYKLGRHDEAAAQLRVATRECGLNIARLCMLGELELENLESDNARKHFQNALAIDEDSAKAKAGLELCKTLTDHVRRHAGAEIPRSFASMCNTLAVALVRDGEFSKGVTQYKAALQLLSEPLVRARVMFNLGLAFVRWEKPGDAVRWFEAAAKIAGNSLPKAQQQLDQLLAKGFKVEASSVEAAADEDIELGIVDGEVIYTKTTPAPTAAPRVDEDDWFGEEKF